MSYLGSIEIAKKKISGARPNHCLSAMLQKVKFEAKESKIQAP